MKKALLIFVVVAGIIAAVVMFNKKSAIAPGPSESPKVSESVSVSPTESATPSVSSTASPTASAKASPSTSTTPKSQTVTVTFTNGTVIPNMLNIRVGDTVKFVNNEDVPHWPASGVHPTHQICPGFDALRGLNNGEGYSFTFREAKTCPFHDHLKLLLNGQIVVNP